MANMFRYFRYLLLIFILLGMKANMSAGEIAANSSHPLFNPTDTTHSPKRAALLSALLPGAGQAYNRKYWKMPIIYAGGITGGYMIVTNSRKYKDFRDAYKFRLDDDTTTIDLYPKYSASQLKVFRDYYRRNMELSVILTTALYLLQILDATVDAHLFDFDVTNNLAIHWQPIIIPTRNVSRAPTMGLSLTFSFSGP